jgi:DNA-binding NtrC family response regulator
MSYIEECKKLKCSGKETVILYLDDEQHNLNSFRINFRRRYGYKVVTAQTPKQALQILEETKVDVFVTDYKMPILDGKEMIDKVKSLYPSIKSMIITAYGDGLKTKVPVLDKPFDFNQIINNIAYICA